MRKLTFLFVALIFSLGAVMAQDAGKLVKTGSKAFAKFKADNSNMTAYDEAMNAADQAIAADASLETAYLLKGNLHAEMVNVEANKVQELRAANALAAAGNPAGAPPLDFSGISYPAEDAQAAIAAYQKAFETAAKDAGKKKAIAGMQTVAGSLSSIGNAMLSADRYEEAYAPLAVMVDIDKYYLANGQEALFQDDAARNQQKYIMAVVSRQMGNTGESLTLHKELYDAAYPEAAVYAGYSALLIGEGQEEEGLAVMSKGRELFPDDSEILFAEINYYIQKEDFTTLEGKLQDAIAKEPDNVGLYNALGNVYMNLSQDEQDAMRSTEYMDKSVKYFSEATKLDENNVDAIYSIGSLYFNKAVAKAQEMNSLGTSKAEQKRYDELNEEINVLFDQALPYFTKAEKIDPDDRNTLIALKEIYARKNDFEKSNMYKARLGEG